MTLTNIILTGGINHDYVDTAEALKEVLGKAGIESIIFDDIDAGFNAIDDGNFDLITMFTLRWRMLDDDKYIPHRDQWAFEITERDRTNLSQHVRSGGGLLGLHTAAICFDTWSEWPQLLGARWVWGTTFHPPPERFRVKATTNHPSLDGLTEFEVVDEIYHNIEPEADAIPLLETQSSEDGSIQTLAWARQVGAGRAIYSAMGHDRASVTTPDHAKFLQQSALWCCGAKS